MLKENENLLQHFALNVYEFSSRDKFTETEKDWEIIYYYINIP